MTEELKNRIIKEGLLASAQEWIDEETIISNKIIKMTIYNWSKIRVYLYWAIVFIIAGLGALKGSLPFDVATIIAVLGIIENGLSPQPPAISRTV